MSTKQRLLKIAQYSGTAFVVVVIGGAIVYGTFVDDGPNVYEKSTTTAPIGATVHYERGGFQEKTVTIPKNSAVRFVNDTTVSLKVASDPHPTHTDLPEFESIRPVKETSKNGSSYIYTFTKAGTWKYHNHAAADHEGVVVVTE